MDYHSLLHYVPSCTGLRWCCCWEPGWSGTSFGSRRWIRLPGGFHFQVSEFVKLVIILLVARYLTELRTDELEIREMLSLAGLVLVPTALVLKQPDLGTALTYLAVLIAGCVHRGIAVEVCGRDRGSDGVGASGQLAAFPEGLSKGAAGELHGPRPGSAGHRIPVDSVPDRRWRGRDVRQGSHQGNPNAASVLARCRTRISSFRRSPRSMGSWVWCWCCRCIS